MSTPAQRAANQANSRKSTGPQTETGKAASSRNSFRHGLSGTFLIQSWEDADGYDELLDGLRREHKPATPTEALLVERMAQHWWLGQRALHLQELTFHPEARVCDDDKQLALYLRYQTTHERAFSKCLNDLNKMRADQLKAAHRMERLALAARAQQAKLQRQETAEIRKTELHQAKLVALQLKTKRQEPKPTPTVSAKPESDVLFDSIRAALADQQAHLQSILSENQAA